MAVWKCTAATCDPAERIFPENTNKKENKMRLLENHQERKNKKYIIIYNILDNIICHITHKTASMRNGSANIPEMLSKQVI